LPAVRQTTLIAGLVAGMFSCGCTSLGRSDGDGSEPRGPKTLLSWEAGRKPAEEPTEGDAEGANGGAKKEEPIATDRPDFTEASSTVGKGRIQLESGYTFTRDRSGGVTTISHSYPEALLRVGMIADWFEFRIAQNFGSTTGHTAQGVFHENGGQDLYVGTKLFLTEQKGALPETSLMLQALVPTGKSDFTAGRLQPGISLLYGWDVIPDRVTLGGSTQGNVVVDPDDHSYLEVAQSLTVGFQYTDRLRSYTEWFAFFPAGATAEGVTAQHYLDGGFTYLVTPNFQLDIRAGIGLSRSADDFFAGAGFAVRY
jgi:hypothetical protein